MKSTVRRQFPQFAARLASACTALLLLGALGCTAGELQAAGSDPNNPGGGSPDAGCNGPLGAPRDPNSGGLAQCCQENLGFGHCLPNAEIPADFQQYTAACTGGGLCVPDTIIATGGVFVPKTCKSIGMADGVCLSTCIPQVAKNAAILPQDTCAMGEVCAPCISPIDNKSTGACEIAGKCVGDTSSNPPPTDPPPPAMCPYTGPPIIDPSTLTACGDGAHCLSDSLVPAAMAAKLGECPDNMSKCVPDDFIKTGGNFIPPTCRSVNDSEGRCLNKVLPDVSKQAALLPQSTCAASELCVPCFSPLDASDTGACKLSCDPGPTEPAKALASCCGGRAKCVPTAAIPMSEQSQLSEQECKTETTDADLCVPNELVQPGFVPPACTATGFLIGDYTGVCLSDCLNFGFKGIVLAQGSCMDQQKCAPCKDPISGQPTGAPGCPP